MYSGAMHQAIILAAGRGTRMQAGDDARLAPGQDAFASAGLKGMIPIHGRPFLDHVLAELGVAGVERVCLVVSPDGSPYLDRYGTPRPALPTIDFAFQPEPRGTAHALLCAQEVVGEAPFLVVNSDNFYPAETLLPLLERGASGVLAIDPERMVAGGRSNISHERMTSYAYLAVDQAGRLEEIVEKPGAEAAKRFAGSALVSVNCWMLDNQIFAACSGVEPSLRGELELPAAVQYAIDRLGQQFYVEVSHAPVLDLSVRSDIGTVADLLPRPEPEE